jgi:hypothetical protein
MSTGANLRTYVLASTSVSNLVGTRVYQGIVPTTASLPFVWFRRRSVEYLNTLGETETVPWREMFDWECVADDPAEADGVADAVRNRLHCAKGTMGTTVYQWVDVQDQSDEYIPRNMQADEVLHIVSLDVEVTNK